MRQIFRHKRWLKEIHRLKHNWSPHLIFFIIDCIFSLNNVLNASIRHVSRPSLRSWTLSRLRVLGIWLGSIWSALSQRLTVAVSTFVPWQTCSPTQLPIRFMNSDFKRKHPGNDKSEYETYRRSMKISFTKLGEEECERCAAHEEHLKTPGHHREGGAGLVEDGNEPKWS